jgi:TolB protein
MKHIPILLLSMFLFASCGSRKAPETPADDSTARPAAEQAQRPPEQRVIVFLREGDIWAARADGTAPRKIVNGCDPEVSPDGYSVAFTEYGRSGARFIAVADLATGTVRRMSTVPGENSYGPRWSPDGRRLAFHHYVQNKWRIGVIDTGDAHFTLLNAPVPDTPFMTLSSLCWGRQGTSMLCQDLASLYEFDLQGQLRQSMPLGALLGADTLDYDFSSANCFILSPDDKLLICDADKGETFTASVFLFDREAKRGRMLTPANYHAHAPAWLVDGRTIVFSGFELTKKNRQRVLSDQPVETSIYAIDLDGGNLKELIRNGETPSVSAR